MDITIEKVETHTGVVEFVCPVCNATAHVHKGDENKDDLYFTLWAICRHNDPTYYGNSRLPSGACAVCGCKE